MNWFWDNIHLKKEERSGMLVFISILFCLLFVKWYILVLYEPQFDNHHAELLASIEYVSIEKEKIDEKRQTPKSVQSTFKSTPKRKKKKEIKISKPDVKVTKTFFKFDPNTTPKDSLVLLGISKYAANNIVKYRSKGGKFKNEKDLQKIYGMDSLTYESVRPYIKIKQAKRKADTVEKRKKQFAINKIPLELKSIDINSADTAALKTLKGIGPVYAKRIVKFRNSLGGFFSLDQINDVWGIEDSLYLAIQPYLTIDTSLIEKKNINALEKESLVKHPYIDWKKAKSIISYKKMHGAYKSMDDFEKLHGLENEFVDTLKHYFVVQ